MEVENYPKWKETTIGDTPVLSPNHDYGRKGRFQNKDVIGEDFMTYT